MFKKIGKFILIFFLVIFLLLGGLLVALRYPSVQTFIAQKVTAILSKSLNTTVYIEKVEISLFNNAKLKNFFMQDLNRDTMIAANELNIKFKLVDLLNKKINVKSVYLDGAIIYLHRDTASITNISEVFKSFKSTKKTEDTTSSKFTWDMDLDELELKRTHFRYFDEKGNMNIDVKVPTLAIALNSVNIDKKIINVESFLLDGANVGIDLLKRAPSPADSSIMKVQFMLAGLQVNYNDFALTNAHFTLNDHNVDTILPRGIDFKHLDVTEINIRAQNGMVTSDSILGKVNQLSAKERSGLIVTNLTADAHISTSDISLSNLHLITPNSDVKNYLSFKFNAFHDFRDFGNAVRIKADFDHTKFALKDLGYFVKNLSKVEHNKVYISGQIDGRINNLKGRGIEINTGSQTVFKGDFYTRGLPNIYESSLNLRVKKLTTTLSDIKVLYPALVIPENLKSLGLLSYSGSLDGFLTDFVSKGTLVTAIGSASTDVNFKYNKKTNKANYKGNVALNEFDLGKFFNNNKNLGKVSANMFVDGGGLTLETLHASINGSVSSITLKDYEYKDIEVNGSVIRKSFSGLVQIHDQYLDMNFNGRVNLANEIPEFRFDASIAKAILKGLKLTKDDIRVAGNISSDFIGNNIDNFIGSIDAKNIVLSRDTITTKIKSLTASVNLLAGKEKEIKINSYILDVDIKGNFSVKELPAALIDFAKYTFTKDYTSTPKYSPQNFSVDVTIYDPGNLPQIIHPKFYIIRNSKITGGFNSVSRKVNLDASIPQIKFDNFDAKTISISSNFENGTIDFKTSIDKVYNGDSLILDTVNVRSKTLENKDIRFDFLAADKKRYNYMNISAFLTPQVGKAVVRIDPSDVKLGNYNWHFDPNNAIFIEGKKIVTQNLAFRTLDQTIYISSYLKDDTSTSVKLTLANTSLSDFTGIFMQKKRDLVGSLNGKVVIEDIFYTPKIFADVVIDQLTLGNELVGDVNIESSLDQTGKKIVVYASVKSSNSKPDYRTFLEAKGYISIDPENPDIKIDIDAPLLGLNFLNYSFFDRYVKNCRGYAELHAKVRGTTKKPLLTGNLTLIKDTLTVSFLNTTYHIDEHKIILDEKGIDVGNIKLYDIGNNPIYGRGRINHQSFKNFALNLFVNTDYAQLINTTPKESPNFYGVAYGRAKVEFDGLISQLVINATATTTAGTHCVLPVNRSFETNKYSFYNFVNPKEEKVTIAQLPQLKLSGVTFKLALQATPDARMDIVLDAATGDMLTAYGSGSLKIVIPRNGNMTIDGNYMIDRGSYFFTLQSIFNKKFDLKQGGTISFNGDIYRAAINVDASYNIRTSVNDLVSDLIASSSQTNTQAALTAAARGRIPVQLGLNLSGVLEKPTISFSIKTTDVDPVIKSYVDQRMLELKGSETELNKQAFGLLVMNRFLPVQTSTSSTGNYAANTATNTVSEFVSSQLNNYLTNLLGYTGNNDLKNLSINIGYNQYDPSTLRFDANGNPITTTNSIRNEVQLALEQRLLNNRLTLNAGGNLDIGNANNVDGGTKAVIPTGDFQIQYALTPDGRWSAKAFNRTNYDFLNSRNTNRTGIGITYRQEFDKPSELFKRNTPRKKKKGNKKESETAKPTKTIEPVK